MMSEILKSHAISLLSDNEEDCKIYANESRLLDFIRGVHAERHELLRWRNSLTETPEDGQIVLIKLAENNYDVCMYDIFFRIFITKDGRYRACNAYDWRPIF
jgi:hypothetical protein